jgi:RNA polymerase sigma-70 factor (ECF subfamily)
VQRLSQAVELPRRVVVDELLVAAARRGDRAAFGRLFEEFAPMVHGILLARVPPDEADDLVQEVFLTALERIATLRDTLAVGAWLAMIARNRAVDGIRGRKRWVPLPPDLATTDPRRSEATEVLAAIRALPEAYREPLILRLVEGMSGPEIAERVGLTPESVRVNLHRGMKQLRDRLGLEEKE